MTARVEVSKRQVEVSKSVPSIFCFFEYFFLGGRDVFREGNVSSGVDAGVVGGRRNPEGCSLRPRDSRRVGVLAWVALVATVSDPEATRAPVLLLCAELLLFVKILSAEVQNSFHHVHVYSYN